MDDVYFKDLVERVASTFVEGVIGSLVVTELTDRSMWLAALSGGVAAALSLVKGLIARHRGLENSASLSRGV